MNLLTNPTFTDWPTGWTTTGFASAVDGAFGVTLPDPPDLLLRARRTGVEPDYGDWGDGSAWQTVTVTPGVSYRIRADVRIADEPSGPANFLLRVKDGTAERQTLLSVEYAALGRDAWTDVSALYTPNSSSLEVRFAAEHVGEAFGDFFVNRTEVYEMAITRQIKDAMVADLESITAGNGYNFTVAEVGVEPKPAPEVTKPAVFILPGEGGSSELAQLTNAAGIASQTYTLQLVVDSAQPNEDMDNFLDDVRNAIERSSSNVNAVSGVEMAAVTGWSEIVTDPGISQNTYFREATVEVRYLYTRGAA